ncbi:YitT family protein [Candidatus Phytoplasma fraxini]|uniref:YitT family protein n=1 Tax=Ash yellows phytoplasma TaxID=35780 RepID=A0ABZ2U888_ASHYP
MNQKRKDTYVLFSFITLFIVLSCCGIINYYYQYVFMQKIEIYISILLSIFGFYFFLLPEQFIIGGLESNLICLDKIFFYNKKKQKYVLSSTNGIIIIRIIILLFALCLLFQKYTDSKQIFFSSIIFSFLFSFITKTFNYSRIKPNTIITQFPLFIKKNIFYKLFLSSIIVGLTIGMSASVILKNKYASGGTDILFQFINSIFKLKLSNILLIMDGTFILLSFIIDLKRKTNNKRKIIMKYIFSITAFLIIFFIIKLRTV